MNIFIYLIKQLILSIGLFAIMVLVGCGDMDDIQEEFILRGETIYTAKADSLEAFGGLNRIKLSFLLVSDPKIHKYKVFWNNHRDSIEHVIERTNEVDTIELILDGLEEGTYFFEVFTYDKVGNSSVQASVIGNAYGDRYASSLLARSHRNLKRIESKALEVEWMTSDEQLIGVDLKYTDDTDVLRSLEVAKKEEFTTLEDFPIGGSFQTRSAFVPEPNAIDTFYTAYSKVTVPTDTVQWQDYPVLFGHKGYLIAMQENGDLMQIDNDGAGSFNFPRKISQGWHPFDALFSHGNGLVARFPDGVLRFYPLSASGTFGSRKDNINSGFDVYNQFFSYENSLLGRKDDGELWKYPFDANGNFVAPASTIPGSWSQYDKMLGSNNALIGRTPDGKLWRIPIDINGVAGTAVEIGTNWDRFDLIANHGNDLIAREPSGKLWHYPINGDGSLGDPTEILVIRESL